MRLVIINLFICGTSGTFFWYPVIFKNFGYILGFFVLLMILLLTYFTNLFILEASEHSKKNDYMNMISFYLGPISKYCSIFTFLFDYFSTYVIGFLITYNVFLNILYNNGYLSDDTLINVD